MTRRVAVNMQNYHPAAVLSMKEAKVLQTFRRGRDRPVGAED